MRVVLCGVWCMIGLALFSLLATCGADDSICLYDAHIDEPTPVELLQPPLASSGAVQASPHFHVVLQHKRAHQGDVNCVRFHPSSAVILLASCGDDGSIKLWRIQHEQQGVAAGVVQQEAFK